jgi:hypothetical protein
MSQHWNELRTFEHTDYNDESSFQKYVNNVKSSKQFATIDVIEAFQMAFNLKIFVYVYVHDELGYYATSEVVAPTDVIHTAYLLDSSRLLFHDELFDLMNRHITSVAMSTNGTTQHL